MDAWRKDADLLFEEFLRRVYVNPNIALNKRKPRRTYLFKIKQYLEMGYSIVDSIRKAYSDLKRDYREGLISKGSWTFARRFFERVLNDEKLLKELRELEGSYFETLFIKLLKYITDLDKITKENVSPEIIARVLNVDMDTLRRFYDWMSSKGYKKIADLLVKAKAAGIQP